MALNLTDLFFNSGDREAFVTKANTMMRRLMGYAVEREEKDAEVNTKAQQATQAAIAAGQDAQLAAKAKQQAEGAALAAQGSADKASLADAAAAKALASERAAADSAQSSSNSATNASRANQIAIDNAQVAIDAAAAALNAKELVVGSIGTAAQQAAAAAKTALEVDMNGYIQQAQTARAGAEQAAALAAQEAKDALAPEMTHYIQQAVAAKDGAVQAKAAANDSYAAFISDLTDLDVSWQNWSQQSALHEQARIALTTDVSNHLNNAKHYNAIIRLTKNQALLGDTGSPPTGWAAHPNCTFENVCNIGSNGNPASRHPIAKELLAFIGIENALYFGKGFNIWRVSWPANTPYLMYQYVHTSNFLTTTAAYTKLEAGSVSGVWADGIKNTWSLTGQQLGGNMPHTYCFIHPTPSSSAGSLLCALPAAVIGRVDLTEQQRWAMYPYIGDTQYD
jgi:hypothetical protein